MYPQTVSMVIRVIGSAINRILNKFGYSIISIQEIEDKYVQIYMELEATYNALLFKDEPSPIHDKRRYILTSKLTGTEPTESIYIINYLHRSLKLDGDVCEFGVAQGATSALIANEIKNTNKSIWLFDSFEGLPKASSKDVLLNDIMNLGSIESYEGVMSFSIESVSNKLKDIDFPKSRTNIIPGWIEETIKNPNIPKRVCFAYVDFDFYEPTLEALKFLDSVLAVNGFIIVDDYEFFSAGAKAAVDEFIDARREKYLTIFPFLKTPAEMPYPSESAQKNFIILHKSTT